MAYSLNANIQDKMQIPSNVFALNLVIVDKGWAFFVFILEKFPLSSCLHNRKWDEVSPTGITTYSIWQIEEQN